MRTKRVKSKKIILACILLFVVLFTYTTGYSNGQASVYEKAKNDAQFEKQVFGGK